MSQPLVFVTTHRIEEGQTEAVEQLAQQFADRAKASPEGLVAYHLYVDVNASTITNVQVHEDSASMDAFLPRVSELIPGALELAPAQSIEIYGTPGPVLQMALDANAEAGASVRVAERHVTGFARPGGLPPA